jgi:hypothetical protein
VKGTESERKISKKIVKAPSAKTPKRKQRGDSFASSDPAVPSSDRRRSGRATVQKSYIESSDEEALDDVVENGDEDMPDASEAESELSPAPEAEAEAEVSSEPEPEPALPIRKSRGRAKKTEPKLSPAPEEAASGLSPEAEPELPIRKGRGRAKKAESELSPKPEQEAAPPAKKGRGKAKKAEPLAEQEEPVSELKLGPQVVRSPRMTRKREVPVVAVSDEESSSLSEEEEDADSPPPKSASRKKATPQKSSPKKTNGSARRKEKAEKVAPAPVKAKTPVRPMPKAKPLKKVLAANTNGRATRGQKTKEVGLYDVPSDSD